MHFFPTKNLSLQRDCFERIFYFLETKDVINFLNAFAHPLYEGFKQLHEKYLGWIRMYEFEKEFYQNELEVFTKLQNESLLIHIHRDKDSIPYDFVKRLLMRIRLQIFDCPGDVKKQMHFNKIFIFDTEISFSSNDFNCEIYMEMIAVKTKKFISLNSCTVIDDMIPFIEKVIFTVSYGRTYKSGRGMVMRRGIENLPTLNLDLRELKNLKMLCIAIKPKNILKVNVVLNSVSKLIFDLFSVILEGTVFFGDIKVDKIGMLQNTFRHVESNEEYLKVLAHKFGAEIIEDETMVSWPL